MFSVDVCSFSRVYLPGVCGIAIHVEFFPVHQSSILVYFAACLHLIMFSVDVCSFSRVYLPGVCGIAIHVEFSPVHQSSVLIWFILQTAFIMFSIRNSIVQFIYI